MKGHHGLRIGSLFSGIGGLELGLEWASVGSVVWQVELDPFCRSILAKHWPVADRSVHDVCRAGAATLAPVDLICGGFPCQDISVAGKGEGLAGARSDLWFEFARIIGELRPRFVVVENVSALLARGMGRVLGDLSELGYDASWTTIRASDVGSPHRRERIFIVAHALRERREGSVFESPAGRTRSLERGGKMADAALERSERDARAGRPARRGSQHVGDEDVADTDGGRREIERLTKSSWEPGSRGSELDGCRDPRRIDCTSRVADAVRDAVRSSEDGHEGRDGAAESRVARAQEGWATQSILGRVAHGLPDRVDRWPAGPGQEQEAWEPPLAIPPKTDRHRRPRLKALGNAVVPQCAYEVGLYVRELLDRP